MQNLCYLLLFQGKKIIFANNHELEHLKNDYFFMGTEDDVTVIAKFDSDFEANLVKGLLESSGITADVMGDSTANTFLKGFEQGMWQLVVRRCDVDRALEIMGNYPADETK